MLSWRYVVLPVVFSCTVFGQSKPPLGREDLIRLLRAGFGEAVLLKAIEVNEARFDVSPQTLLALKEAGASDKVMSAMMSTAQAQQAGGKLEIDLLEPGVYAKARDGYVPLDPETLSCCERLGEDTGWVTLLAEALRTHSRTKLSSSAEFLIVCAKEAANCDYQLLRAGPRVRPAKWFGWTEDAEVRVFGIKASLGEGEVVGLEGFRRDAKGTSRQPPLQRERVSDHAFRVRPPELPKGEYGFLPLARLKEKKVAPVGRIHTFSIE